MGEICNPVYEFKFFFVKIVHLVDRTDLFKISKLAYGARVIVADP